MIHPAQSSPHSKPDRNVKDDSKDQEQTGIHGDTRLQKRNGWVKMS